MRVHWWITEGIRGIAATRLQNKILFISSHWSIYFENHSQKGYLEFNELVTSSSLWWVWNNRNEVPRINQRLLCMCNDNCQQDAHFDDKTEETNVVEKILWSLGS